MTMTAPHTSHRSLTDADLASACAAGSEEAWAEFVHRFGRLVYAAARRRGLSDANAEEVLQTTMETAWTHIGQLRDPAAIRSWLLTTAMRECWRLGRKAARRPRSVEGIGEPEAQDDDDLRRWERQDVVRTALETLGDPCRSLLVAVFKRTEGEGYADVARRLGVPVGSIGPTRGRCFRKLEVILDRMGFKP